MENDTNQEDNLNNITEIQLQQTDTDTDSDNNFVQSENSKIKNTLDNSNHTSGNDEIDTLPKEDEATDTMENQNQPDINGNKEKKSVNGPNSVDAPKRNATDGCGNNENEECRNSNGSEADSSTLEGTKKDEKDSPLESWVGEISTKECDSNKNYHKEEKINNGADSGDFEINIDDVCLEMIENFSQKESVLWSKTDEYAKEMRQLIHQFTHKNLNIYSDEFEPFIKKIQRQNQEEVKKETKEFNEWHDDAKKWCGLYDKIFDQLPGLIESQKKIIEELDENDLEPLSDPDKKLLSNRKKGTDIILRMLSKLPERKKETKALLMALELKENMIGFKNLIKKLDVFKLMGAKEDIVPGIEATAKAIQGNYKEIRDHNYHIIRKQREAAEKIKKQTLSFIEQQLIPAVDGIDSGLQNEGTIGKTLGDVLDHKEIIGLWLGVYSKMSANILEIFEEIDLEKISVKRGQKFDEKIHNAMGTEENPDMENETINSVIRNGYMIGEILIRAADVEVIMNN
jgi:molecular chaperone GrpE (heat shock protein)